MAGAFFRDRMNAPAGSALTFVGNRVHAGGGWGLAPGRRASFEPNALGGGRVPRLALATVAREDVSPASEPIFG
jgi:hypothetical protein